MKAHSCDLKRRLSILDGSARLGCKRIANLAWSMHHRQDRQMVIAGLIYATLVLITWNLPFVIELLLAQ